MHKCARHLTGDRRERGRNDPLHIVVPHTGPDSHGTSARGPVAYDCVKVIVVRDGSAILFSEFGQQPVKPGDVILLGANVLWERAGARAAGASVVTR